MSNEPIFPHTVPDNRPGDNGDGRRARLACNGCGRSVSTPFTPEPTDTPDGGLIVRAFVQCPDCLARPEVALPSMGLLGPHHAQYAIVHKDGRAVQTKGAISAPSTGLGRAKLGKVQIEIYSDARAASLMRDAVYPDCEIRRVAIVSLDGKPFSVEAGHRAG